MADESAPTVSRAQDEYRYLLECTMSQFHPIHPIYPIHTIQTMRDNKPNKALALLEIIRNQAAASSIEVTRGSALPRDFFLIDVITFALRDLRRIIGDQPHRPESALTR